MSQIFHHNFPRKNISPFPVILGIIYPIFGEMEYIFRSYQETCSCNNEMSSYVVSNPDIHVNFKIRNMISEHRYLLMIEVIKNSFFFSCFLCRKNSGLGVRNPYKASHWPIILSSIMACWSKNKLKHNI